MALVFKPEDAYTCDVCGVHWWSLSGVPLASAPTTPVCPACLAQVALMLAYHENMVGSHVGFRDEVNCEHLSIELGVFYGK